MPSEPLAFRNGRFVPLSALTVAGTDAGFVSAATVTDFARTYGRKLFRWPDHLVRFRRDCAACRIPLPLADAELTAAAERLVAENGQSLAPADELAVVTFATPGPLAHLAGAAHPGPPTVGMHALCLPVERYARFSDSGVSLSAVGTHDRSSLVPGGAKHRSRLHWYLAEKAAADLRPGAVAVLTDEHGASADTALGGVLAVAGNVVYRSPVGRVQDSISVNVTKELCAANGLNWVEAAFDFEALCRPVEPLDRGTFPDRVTEILLAGSGFGLAGAVWCGTAAAHREYDWPGPVCRKLQAAWRALTG